MAMRCQPAGRRNALITVLRRNTATADEFGRTTAAGFTPLKKVLVGVRTPRATQDLQGESPVHEIDIVFTGLKAELSDVLARDRIEYAGQTYGIEGFRPGGPEQWYTEILCKGKQ